MAPLGSILVIGSEPAFAQRLAGLLDVDLRRMRFVPLSPACVLLEHRPIDGVVIDARIDSALAVAECARVRSEIAGVKVVLVGSSGAALQEPARRAGATEVLQCDLLLDGPCAAVLCDGVRIERSSRRVWVDAEERALSRQKFDILCYFLDNPGRAVSASELVRKQLLAPSQGGRYKGLISELRERLGPAGKLLRAVPGYGYRMDLASPENFASQRQPR